MGASGPHDNLSDGMTVPETLPETSGPASSGRRFQWPADYYSSPSPEAVMPRAAAYGCGAASALVLLLVFAGGAFLSGGGFAQFMDFAMGMSLGEMRGQFGADVTPARKASLEAEIERLRQSVRDEKTPVTSMQPFLVALRNAGSDKKITAEEAAQLEQTARKINLRSKR
jgi:hypothetical protein